MHIVDMALPLFAVPAVGMYIYLRHRAEEARKAVECRLRYQLMNKAA